MTTATEKRIYTIPTEKEHTIYKDANGNMLPGTTTVLSILAKPALYQWYFKMGKAGENPFKKKDNAADIGTIAHAFVMCHLKGWELDTSNLVPANVSTAENCVLSYYEWEKGQELKPILIESELVNGEWGGTVDLYAELNGEPCLIDFKTSSGIYVDMSYQLAAYTQLLKDNGYPVSRAIILNIGKDENSDFQTKSWTNLDRELEIFRNCLNIYRLTRTK